MDPAIHGDYVNRRTPYDKAWAAHCGIPYMDYPDKTPEDYGAQPA
jgi:hypothetical protein